VIAEEIAIVVAVGPLGRGKSRLGPSLSADDRRQLVLAMLQDVLAAILEAHSGPTFVVTPDAEVGPVARALGAQVLRDAGEGTNAAIETAIANARIAAAPAVLVIQGDLPQLTPADVRRCLDALASVERGAVLVPGDDGGTSVLGIRPPFGMPSAFGPQSAQRHREAALEARIPLQELEIAALAADVDTVADLDRVRSAVGPATAALLARITVGAAGEGGAS